jgi:predicted RNase H-like nuclease
MLAWAIGVDLAWSPRNPSGVAVGRIQEEQVSIEWTGRVVALDEVVERCAALRDREPVPVTIAVDAPTVVPNLRGSRPVEQMLQRRLAARHAAPYPANRQRLAGYNRGRPRGEELVALLRGRLGAQEYGLPPRRHQGVCVMEVFPAAALVQLFELKRGLRYKKKPGRSRSSCRRELKRLLNLLEGLRDPRLVLDLSVSEQRGRAFKDLEDRVDAACCAYLAALAWLHGELRLEQVGSLEQGYVVLPRGKGI